MGVMQRAMGVTQSAMGVMQRAMGSSEAMQLSLAPSWDVGSRECVHAEHGSAMTQNA